MQPPGNPDIGKDMPSTSKRVLIVGASSSVGRATVQTFAAAGHRVLATARDTSAAVFANGVIPASLDLSRPESIASFIDRDVRALGALDVVILLPGLLPGRALADYDDALIHEVMDINFSAQAMLVRQLLPWMAEGSQLLMMSSVSGERGSYDPIYAAAKAAVIGFVKSLGIALAPRIRVNALAPALIADTSMYAQMQPARRAYHLEHTPTGRLTTPTELAALMLQICGPAWANLNGQVIRINGGAHV